MALASILRRSGARAVIGFARDPHDPDRTLVVDLLADGVVFATLRADRTLPALEAAGRGHGFSADLPDAMVEEGAVVEARLANLDTPVGTPLEFTSPGVGEAARPEAGEAEWLGGLHIAGWASDPDGAPLSILVDGVLVERVRPTAWRSVGPAGDQAAVRGFAVHLPERFADGRVHRCAVLTPRGEELNGSPIAVLAYADGLRGALVGPGLSEHDRLRATLFDQLIPASLPFSAAPTEPPDTPNVTLARTALVLIGGEAEAAATIAGLRGQDQGDWVAGALPARDGPTGFAAADLRHLLDDEAPDCPVIVFALAGTLLRTGALRRIAAAFAAEPAAELVYPDIAIAGQDGTIWPLALPALDYERLLEQGYCTLVFALGRSALERALDAGASDLPRLVNALFDAPSDPAPLVVHLPGVLATLPAFDRQAASRTLAASTAAHLRRRGIDASARTSTPGLLPAVRVRRPESALTTTILIPTRNRRDLLEACLASIRPAAQRHDAEILIVDNDTTDPDALALLAGLRQEGIGVLRVPGPFNFAKLINRGAAEARGEALCLLNNDVVAQDADWLDELLGRLADETVGAVAPLLVWPSGVVQHGGLVLGPRFEAASAFTDRLDSDPGYADMLHVARECSAVTAACLLTRREDFIALGGLDGKRFPINYNDVDYCLSLREAGRRVVFTPHARLVHPESSSRGRAWSPDRRALFSRERRALQLKWGDVLADDPFYSPLLTLGPQPFAGLASPARPLAPRLNRAPRACDVPEGAT